MIYVRNGTRKRRISPAAWQRRAEALLEAAGLPGAGLSLSFVGDRAMRRLNRDYRGRDRATDVLSFPLYEPFAIPKRRAGRPAVFLGDVVIDLDVADRQARAYGASLRAEISRLLIHGVLHLIGHDHEAPVERRRMVRAERRLAEAIGLPWPYEAPS